MLSFKELTIFLDNKQIVINKRVDIRVFLIAEFYTYIYKDVDGKILYVGKGKDVRCFSHFYKRSHHLGNILRKRILNKQKIELHITSEISEEKAFLHEIELIREIGRADLGLGPLLNMTDGGDGVCGLIFSAEVKTKISRSKLGKSYSSDLHKSSVREALLGKPKTREAKDKMSIAHKGKVKTPEHLAAIGAGNRSKVTSDETKAKISIANTGKIGNRGKVTSDETKAKISIANTGKIRNKITCNHCNKAGSANTMARWHFDNCKHRKIKC